MQLNPSPSAAPTTQLDRPSGRQRPNESGGMPDSKANHTLLQGQRCTLRDRKLTESARNERDVCVRVFLENWSAWALHLLGSMPCSCMATHLRRFDDQTIPNLQPLDLECFLLGLLFAHVCCSQLILSLWNCLTMFAGLMQQKLQGQVCVVCSYQHLGRNCKTTMKNNVLVGVKRF